MGYPPYRLLALTFTNKAANEMKERIAALVGTETAQRLWAGTFHSIFSRILRANADRLGYRHDFTIYDVLRFPVAYKKHYQRTSTRR